MTATNVYGQKYFKIFLVQLYCPSAIRQTSKNCDFDLKNGQVWAQITLGNHRVRSFDDMQWQKKMKPRNINHYGGYHKKLTTLPFRKLNRNESLFLNCFIYSNNFNEIANLALRCPPDATINSQINFMVFTSCFFVKDSQIG